MASQQRSYFVFLGLMLLLSGCGKFKTAELASTGFQATTVGAPKFACTDGVARGTTDASIRRLTRFEYENTLKDIFGTDVITGVRTLIGDYPDDVLRTVKEFNPTHSSEAVNAQFEVAAAIAESVTANMTLLKRVVPTCLVNSAGAVALSDDACVQKFVSELGLKIYRRPLASAEAAEYVATLKGSSAAAESSTEKVAVVIGQMLMKPEMIFHLTHAKTPRAGKYAVDQFTVASRLSYRTIGSLPDAELFAAAQNQQLSNPAVLKAHALRLLKKAPSASHVEHAGRRFVRHFVSTWLEMPSARNPDIFYSEHLAVNQTTLKASAMEEGMRFAEHVVIAKSGSFADLMTSSAAFPPDADLAKIMGTAVSRGADDPKQVSDSRRGILQRPVMMLSSEPRTSPIHRGAGFIRQIQCLDIGSPPANADEVAAEAKSDVDINTLTARQIAHLSTSSNSCLGCHSMINPPGFAFESFGPFGEMRKAEKVFNTDKSFVTNLTIDTRTAVPIDARSVSVADSAQLADILAESGQAKACFAQQMFRLTRFNAEVAADDCHLSEIERAIRSGQPLIEVFAANGSTEDIFWDR